MWNAESSLAVSCACAAKTVARAGWWGFPHVHVLMLDGAPYRAFDTMEEYRQWCEANLPEWLGYSRV